MTGNKTKISLSSKEALKVYHNKSSILKLDINDQITISNQIYIVSQIRHGGAGKVICAYQIDPIRSDSFLPHKVAIKVSSLQREDTYRSKAFFTRELAVWANLKHKNIYPMNAVLVDQNEHLGVCMKYCELSLRRLLTKKAITQKDSINALKNMVNALKYAHSKNVIHLDVKPENILIRKTYNWHGMRDLINPINQWTALLADWGISSIRNESHTDKLTDSFKSSVTMNTFNNFGTLAYMAPERFIIGNRSCVQSDIYSIGILFYEVIVGELPFNTKKSLYEQITSGEYLRTVKQKLNNEHKYILKAIAPDPGERYDSMLQFEDELPGSIKSIIREQSVQAIKDKVKTPNISFILKSLSEIQKPKPISEIHQQSKKRKEVAGTLCFNKYIKEIGNKDKPNYDAPDIFDDDKTGFFHEISKYWHKDFIREGTPELVCEYLDWEDEIATKALDQLIYNRSRRNEFNELCKDQKLGVQLEKEYGMLINGNIRRNIFYLDDHLLWSLQENNPELIQHKLNQMLEAIIEESIYLKTLHQNEDLNLRIYEKLFLIYEFVERRNMEIHKALHADTLIIGNSLKILHVFEASDNEFNRLWLNYVPINIYLALWTMIIVKEFYIPIDKLFSIRYKTEENETSIVYSVSLLEYLTSSQKLYHNKYINYLLWLGTYNKSNKIRSSFIFGYDTSGSPFLENQKGIRTKVNLPLEIYDPSSRFHRLDCEVIIKYLLEKHSFSNQ